MVSMADEFKIDWEKAIEDAAIEYADAYVELQCDSENDHQREHREALRDLRETIKRGLECAAAPQPAAQPVAAEVDLGDGDWRPHPLDSALRGGFADGIKVRLLYAAPQPEAQPELTDFEIDKALTKVVGDDKHHHAWLAEIGRPCARAIIAAHEAKRGAA